MTFPSSLFPSTRPTLSDPLRAVYRRVTAGAPPVTIEEARLHLRLENQADDLIVNALLAVASDLVERHTGRALRENVWDVLLDCFADPIPIDLHPVKEITQISHIVSDAPVVVTPSLYYLKHLPQAAEVRLTVDSEWPDDTDERDQAVTVRITTEKRAEYTTLGRVGVLHVLQYLYENRGDVDLPDGDVVQRSGAQRILDPMTIVRI